MAQNLETNKIFAALLVAGITLWGVVNANKGVHAGYAYSDALMAKGGSWNYDSLNKFLWKPKKYIEGTKMNYLGLKKPADRAAMIAWMRTLAPSPAALPSAGQIAAEAAELAPPVAEEAVEDAVEKAVEGVKDAAHGGGH